MNRKWWKFLFLLPISVCTLYAGGYAAQFIKNYQEWTSAGNFAGNGTYPQAASLHPLVCFHTALTDFPYNLYGIFLCLVLFGLLTFLLMRMGYDRNGEISDHDRNLNYSTKGTYGTSGFMTPDEMMKVLELTGDVKKNKGTILGKLNGKAVCLPYQTRMNKNIAVYGASGSMKSRAFARNMIFQCVARGQEGNNASGESLIITDPKSELYESMSVYGDISLRQNKVLNNMLGCEIDFIIKGLDTKSRSIVASRKDAMLKKRQIFYFDQDSSGQTKIHEDRIVQARVIAVAEKVVRAEIFGVETSILARDLSFDWLGDARERFQVGEHILVRILNVDGDSPETLSIHADVKSVEGNTSKENLKNCRVQGKYAGTVEDIHKGTVFVRLELGVNAIAHSCYDSRTVGKKDKVSFVVTHIDEERNVAVGIITRIIKQNI